MAHNKIIDSVKKQGQVAIKDLDEFLRFVINESDMRTYDDNYISILIPMKFDIDKVFGLDEYDAVLQRFEEQYKKAYGVAIERGWENSLFDCCENEEEEI